MSTINSTTYYTLSQLNAMAANLTKAEPTYTSVNNAQLGSTLLGIGGAIIKDSNYAIPIAASLKFLDYAGAMGDAYKSQLKAIYESCIKVMSGCNYTLARLSFYSTSTGAGIYLAEGFPRVTGYKQSNGNWVLVN